MRLLTLANCRIQSQRAAACGGARTLCGAPASTKGVGLKARQLRRLEPETGCSDWLLLILPIQERSRRSARNQVAGWACQLSKARIVLWIKRWPIIFLPYGLWMGKT